MINPVQLQTLTVVVEVGSFADAARRLGYSSSAVSQQMAALERQLRTPLFERDARGVRPTPAAVTIVERSAAVLGALRTLEEDVTRVANGLVGRLRVGSFASANERLLPGVLSRLRRDRPGVEVHLDEAEPEALMPLLERRELDVALVYRYGSVRTRWPRSVRSDPVLAERLLLVRPDDGTAPPELADLADATWVATREGTWGSTTLARLARANGFEPRVNLRSNNYAVVLGLVAAGLGVALVPALAFWPAPGVSATPLADPDASREVLVSSVPGARVPLVDGFVDAVQAACRALAGRDEALWLPGSG